MQELALFNWIILPCCLMPLNIECSMGSCYCTCARTPVPKSKVFLACLHRVHWHRSQTDRPASSDCRDLCTDLFSAGSCMLARNRNWSYYWAQSVSSTLNLCAHFIPLLGYDFNIQPVWQRQKKKLHLHSGSGVFLKCNTWFCTRNIFKETALFTN